MTDFLSANNKELVSEIRIRQDRPFIIRYKNRDVVFNDCIVECEELNNCMLLITRYSLYAYQKDIGKGFVTIRGGHRVGISGHVIIENNIITGQKYINSINIRVAHEMTGCGNAVMDFIANESRIYPENTLIISPPGCGKTTLLRDLIRQLSEGTRFEPMNVSVIDERSEIGASFEGHIENDLGPRTDLLDGCSKAEGIEIMVRSMAPNVVAVDELGNKNDIKACLFAINSGCTIFATIHGRDLSSAEDRFAEDGFVAGLERIFNNVIVLSKDNGVGTVKEMIRL